MPNLHSLLTLEYGEALTAELRSGHGYPVFGSNGEVGRHYKFLVPESGIIIGRKGSVGKVTWSEEPFWPIDTTYWVSCAPEDRRWLYWVLSWLPLARLDSSTGVPGLNRNDVYALSVDQPSIIERQKIVQILDTLDTAIHETEAIIAKLKAVKQGLLHDLLTRGIDANGKLRPPQAEAPHLYKGSPLGWIPKEWELAQLSSRIARLDAGISVNSEDRPHGAGEIGVLKTSALSRGEFRPDQNKTVVATEVAWVRESVASDSILVSRMNTPELVGESCYVTDPWPNLFLPDRVWQLKKGEPDSVDMKWLSLVFLTSRYRSYVQIHATGTSGSMKNLPKARLLAMPIAFPNLDEQGDIASRIWAIDEKIVSEVASMEKLKAQKFGLMDDLLTGRVRVTPLLEAAGT